MSRKTTPRETEKPKKLTRAQKKEIDAVLRKYKGDGKPRTAQATIPYEAIYPDGVCRIDRRTFSKCITFEDISYQLAQPETRTAIFEHLCDLYNYVDASIHVQLSFLNRKVDPVQYAKSFEIAPQGDDFDDIRAEYTAILQKQLASGNNGIVKALPQPGLGRVADGFPAQMDGHSLWAEEPADISRLTEDVPNRSKRMKTLGNAVSPPQVFPILKYIADIETGRCPMGGEEL